MGQPGARVLVVDDSPYTRQVLRNLLRRDPLVSSVEVAGDGRIALQKALRKTPDLITLDLRMPTLDGFTFLRLFRARSKAPVLVLSSHGELSNVEKALQLGASGFICKPADPYRDLDAVAEELYVKLRQHLRTPTSMEQDPVAEGASSDSRFPILAIGSSSGGPSHLQYLLSGLPKKLRAAVLIAQHMPPGFTEGFAKRLDGLLPHAVRQAADGDRVVPGQVLLAPGGYHMAIELGAGGACVAIEEAKEDLHVPSVDRLLETCAKVFGSRLTALILTGMGRDGALGVRAVKRCGGRVISESEETAPIYGMPREAAATGCVDEILPLQGIAVRIIDLLEAGPLSRDRTLEGAVEPSG